MKLGGKLKLGATGHVIRAGDIVGGDKVAGDKIGRDKVVITAEEVGEIVFEQAKVTSREHLPSFAVAALEKLETEIDRGPRARSGVIEEHLNALLAMGVDALEVALACIASPLAGLGLVAKKVGDRVRLEAKWAAEALEQSLDGGG